MAVWYYRSMFKDKVTKAKYTEVNFAAFGPTFQVTQDKLAIHSVQLLSQDGHSDEMIEVRVGNEGDKEGEAIAEGPRVAFVTRFRLPPSPFGAGSWLEVRVAGTQVPAAGRWLVRGRRMDQE